MTNEELLAAIRLIVKEELARQNSVTATTDETIVEGPDEFGRVKFAGTEKVREGVWVLSILTLRQALAGKIAPLTMKQLASLMMNALS